MQYGILVFFIYLWIVLLVIIVKISSRISFVFSMPLEFTVTNLPLAGSSTRNMGTDAGCGDSQGIQAILDVYIHAL